MNSVNAVAGCSWSMRKLMKNTRPSVASISTIGTGLLKSVWPNGVRPVMAPLGPVDDGRVEGQPRGDAGERDADRHVVVDADHVGAQARIDRGCPVGAVATAGS